MNFDNVEGEPLKIGTEVGCWIGPCFCRCVIVDYREASKDYGNTYGVKHGGIVCRIYPNDIWIVKGD